MPPVLSPTQRGSGPGWDRLAAALREALPGVEIDGVWVFRTMRADPREFGTAILSRVDAERRRIYTARYSLTIKGRQRGGFEWGLQEVGSGPLEALEELLALVPARGVEDEPPVAIPVERWFPPDAPEADDVEPAG
ncbi:MAG TPA: hypothetical protein VF862_06350 [Gemmatimonadales bacterium]